MLSDWLSKDRSGPLTTLVLASEPTGEIPVSMSATVVPAPRAPLLQASSTSRLFATLMAEPASAAGS